VPSFASTSFTPSRLRRYGVTSRQDKPQPAGRGTQGIFAEDPAEEAGQKLPPCERMPAAALPGDRFDPFVKTISGMNLKSC